MQRYRSFGFSAEFPGGEPAYDEFEKYLRIEFSQRHPGWEPRFGKAVWLEPTGQGWGYMFLLSGNVPEARTLDEARRNADRLVRGLGSGFKAAHANPGDELSDPVVRVWEWELAPALR